MKKLLFAVSLFFSAVVFSSDFNDLARSSDSDLDQAYRKKWEAIEGQSEGEAVYGEAVFEVSEGLSDASLVMTTEIPTSALEVTEGFTDPSLTLETHTTLLKAPCSRDRAEAYAIAYNTSGRVDTNILHKGYHEAVLVNCSKRSRYFTVETILTTAKGERFYGKTPIGVAGGASTVARFRSAVNARYYNRGQYRLTSTTKVSGAASAKAVRHGRVTVR